ARAVRCRQGALRPTDRDAARRGLRLRRRRHGHQHAACRGERRHRRLHRQAATRLDEELSQASSAAAHAMKHVSYTDAYIAGILGEAKTIAMVGASATSNRPSYFAMKYLLGRGYCVGPINPG